LSKAKNHNSILFLTTLGLYLGLVMAGASPQVLAQAATARNFDIKDEVEFKDDLDKKPDTDEPDLSSFALQDYLGGVEGFLNDLRYLHQINGFDSARDEFDQTQGTGDICKIGGAAPIRGEVSRSDKETLERVVNDALYSLTEYDAFADCLPRRSIPGRGNRTMDVQVAYDTSALIVKISIDKSSPERAELMVGDLVRVLDGLPLNGRNATVKTIAKNTFFSFQNNQVFIVTRLPRGSIDSLLRS
jgi:hypothetical protein